MSNIVIRGCSAGIRFATAVALAKNKHNVFAMMRTPSKNGELEDVDTKKKLPIIILPLGVSNDNSVNKAIKRELENT